MIIGLRMSGRIRTGRSTSWPADEFWRTTAYEGVKCLEVSKTEPTMNCGWLRADSPTEEIESTMLHEFGHVLGLVHEHANPAGSAPWDEKKTIHASLTGPPLHWQKAFVDREVLGTWPQDRFLRQAV